MIKNYFKFGGFYVEKNKINFSIFIASPVWSIEPQDVDIVEGETAIFHCYAEGSPTPDITWNSIGKYL